MSEENVKRMRLGFEALNRGDVDAILELVDQDVVFEPLRAPVSGAYHGPEGIRQYLADTAETFDRFRVEASDLRDLGNGRVLVIGTMHARVRHGGVETEAASAGIATFRAGRLIAWKDFGDRARALEAAGLSE